MIFWCLARQIVPFIALLLASGCTDAGAGCAGPYGWPARSIAQTESIDRVCGVSFATMPPIRPAAANIWPGASRKVPTMLDMERQRPVAVRSGYLSPAARKQRGGFGLCRPDTFAQGDAKAGHAVAPPGVALGLCYAAPSRNR